MPKLLVPHLLSCTIWVWLHLSHACVCTTGGAQALPGASMALQQLHDRPSLRAGEAVSSTQQGPGDDATQLDFTGFDTAQTSGTDNELSAFLSGAAVYHGVHGNQQHLSCLLLYCLIHSFTWLPTLRQSLHSANSVCLL